jgi:hypothetical protein
VNQWTPNKPKEHQYPNIERKGARHNGKPPARKKNVSTNYGSVNTGKKHKESLRNSSSKESMGKTSNLINTRKILKSSCSLSNSSGNSEDSCISSSDLTSNQSGDDEDSSVYAEENDSLTDDYISFEEDNNERSSLLPSGIKTYESGNQRGVHPKSSGRSKTGSRRTSNHGTPKQTAPQRRDMNEGHIRGSERKGRSSRSRNSRRRDMGRPFSEYDPYCEEDSYDSSHERRHVDRYNRKLLYEKERQRMEKRIRKQMMKELEEQRCCYRFSRWCKSVFRIFLKKVEEMRCEAQTFIGNLPLTIGAIGLAIVTLGVVWFKFAEVMLDTCKPVHFHSTQCNFPEFPGCFYCDKNVRAYKIAYSFHQACSAVAGAIAFLFVLKICVAKKVVIDEMNSPTTSSPAGLICMTIVCVAAGRGLLGKLLVTSAAALHFCVAVWFILMAGSFNILPDPSWYPNTVGIGVSAVKTWLYYPMAGHFLMLVS